MNKLLLIALLAVSVCSLNGITELSDATFKATVNDDNSIWVVLFAAEWCGHCKHLKPELEKVAPRLNALGVKVGHVDEKNNQKLINKYVVDHKTHMVGYPKLKVILGDEELAEIPGSVRKADLIYNWIAKEYNLTEQQQEEL